MILDTNAISAIFGGEEDVSEVLEGTTRHHLPVIVLGEYRYGLARSRKRRSLLALLDRMERESIVLVIDAETARHYALVRDELRKLGRPIPENDVWIAALAMQHRQPIVSHDTHFDVVPGVTRLSW